MHLKEVINTIEVIENEFDVWNLKYNGEAVWPIIRLEIANTLFGDIQHSQESSVKEKRSLKKRLADVYWISRDLLSQYFQKKKFLQKDPGNNINKPFRADFFVYQISSHRSVVINEKYFNRVTDSLQFFLQNFGTSFTAETITNEVIYPRYNKSYLVDHLLTLQELKCKIIYSLSGQQHEITHLESFLEYLKTKSIIINVNTVLNRCAKIFYYSVFFKRLFEKVKPKILFLDIFYHEKGLAALLAAKELNIRTIDLQHGVQGDYHYCYANYRNVPKEGSKFLPDLFALWDQNSFNTIHNWSFGLKSHFPMILGHLFISLLKDGRINLQMPEWIKSKLTNKRVILITLARTSEDEISYLKMISDIIQSTDDSFFWIFRCHPDYVEKNKKELEKISIINGDKVNIHSPGEINLYGLLNGISTHITYISSVCLEAQTHGIQNIVVGQEGYNVYQSYIKSQEFDYADNQQDLENLILNKSTSRGKGVIVSDSKYIYNQLSKIIKQ